MELGFILATLSKNLQSSGHHNLPSLPSSTPSSSVVASAAAVSESSTLPLAETWPRPPLAV